MYQSFPSIPEPYLSHDRRIFKLHTPCGLMTQSVIWGKRWYMIHLYTLLQITLPQSSMYLAYRFIDRKNVIAYICILRKDRSNVPKWILYEGTESLCDKIVRDYKIHLEIQCYLFSGLPFDRNWWVAAGCLLNRCHPIFLLLAAHSRNHLLFGDSPLTLTRIIRGRNEHARAMRCYYLFCLLHRDGIN